MMCLVRCHWRRRLYLSGIEARLREMKDGALLVNDEEEAVVLMDQ